MSNLCLRKENKSILTLKGFVYFIISNRNSNGSQTKSKSFFCGIIEGVSKGDGFASEILTSGLGNSSVVSESSKYILIISLTITLATKEYSACLLRVLTTL